MQKQVNGTWEQMLHVSLDKLCLYRTQNRSIWSLACTHITLLIGVQGEAVCTATFLPLNQWCSPGITILTHVAMLHNKALVLLIPWSFSGFFPGWQTWTPDDCMRSNTFCRTKATSVCSLTCVPRQRWQSPHRKQKECTTSQTRLACITLFYMIIEAIISAVCSSYIPTQQVCRITTMAVLMVYPMMISPIPMLAGILQTPLAQE